MRLDPMVEKIHGIVRTHELQTGVYCRWLWQNEKGSRKLGINEYGCADAANILYSIGRFPKEAAQREKWVAALQGMQDPETGLFHEATHHTIHTTAHCLAALELFDASPLYPLTALKPYLDKEKLFAFLNQLDWDHNPWPSSHQGAGLFASFVITRMADGEWQQSYFTWLKEHCDPATALGLKDRRGDAPLPHQLYGWFHYLFNHEYARQPIPRPETLIDSCLEMYKKDHVDGAFGKEVGFREIDWIFAVNRATRQTSHRFDEAKEALRDCAEGFLAYLEGLDEKTDDCLNDLHMLFGAVCALAELQLALPGEYQSEVPLKNVLDRRPFI